MKKRIKISTAIPASMSDFQAIENSHLTSATLKVFHSGETGDGRWFTPKFADKIAATIGGTPIVAKYDEEEDDFIGHAASQSVFGFIPEIPIIRTEIDDDGNSWLLTEVRLFTERHDVGSIARKIVGRAQSLELDPDSIDARFIYDSEGEFSKIEFHDGSLIGLSVLGYNQAPAFAGSGFFTEAIKADKIEELIAKYNNIPTSIVMETGGKSMLKNKFDNQDGTDKDVREAITPEFDPILEVEKDEPVVLAEKEEVVELPQEEEAVEEESVDEVVEDEVEVPEPVVEEPEVEEPVVEEPIVEEPAAVIPEDEGEGDDFESNTEEPSTEEIGLESQTEESSTDTPTFSDADREELESYRRADKIGIIASYAEYFSEDELLEFEKVVDAFTKDELDKELSFKAMQALRNKKENKPTFSFNLQTVKNVNQASDPVADAIKNYRGEQ